ncbi:hypothetical protein EWM64_g18 [Hericium alpestre]|uniref:F-box domain-containing protein n=1 Tax=Hericium alpestre TaxID=135208 RepID=A0A4Z0ACB2_9AGAM|nr:hypothetical protein EWM64_g18 [Hericium alpestre]
MLHRSPPPTAIVAGCQTIDERIESLVHELTTLREYKNSFAPISRLPAELIALIFFYYQAMQRAAAKALRQNEYVVPSWLNVTYVCRRWRHIALEIPTLWVDIVIHKYWTQEMLRRSRNAPLILDVVLPFPNNSTARPSKFLPTVKLALEQLHRAGELNLVGHWEVLQEVMAQLSVKRAPLLSSLSLTSQGGPQMIVPPNIFAGEVPPLLCHVTLWNCDVAWDSPFLSQNLVSLTVMGTYRFERPTNGTLLNALSGMTELESLTLNALPWVNPTSQDFTSPLPAQPTILLPSLSRLRLTGRAIECDEFMNRLSMPALTSLSLKCQIEVPGALDLEGIFEKITQIVNGTSRPHGPDTPLHCIRVGDLDTAFGLHIEGWSGVPPADTYEWPRPAADPVVSCRFWWTETLSERLEIPLITKFMATVPVQDVRTLVMHPPYFGSTPIDWTACFGRLARLQAIHIRDWSTMEVLFTAWRAYISWDPSYYNGGSSSDESDLTPCAAEYPELRSLHVVDVELYGIYPRSNLRAPSEILVEILTQRARRSLKLEKLWICGDGIEEAAVEKLKTVVSQVNWDSDRNWQRQQSPNVP